MKLTIFGNQNITLNDDQIVSFAYSYDSSEFSVLNPEKRFSISLAAKTFIDEVKDSIDIYMQDWLINDTDDYYRDIHIKCSIFNLDMKFYYVYPVYYMELANSREVSLIFSQKPNMKNYIASNKKEISEMDKKREKNLSYVGYAR